MNGGLALDGEHTSNGELVIGKELVLDRDFIALNGQILQTEIS